MTARTVLPKRTVPDEARFHALIVQGLARVAAQHGRGTLSDAMGRSGRQLDNVFAGSDPKAKALFDVLALDPTALDEILSAYGLRTVPLAGGIEDDLRLAAGLSNGLSKLIESAADGVRDHNETLAIAALLRPHVGPINAIINQADDLTRPRH